MGNVYEEISEKLGKLRRNETQMTEEQKKKYARQLKALQKKIAEDASAIMRGFVLSGVKILKGDGADEAIDRINKILEQERAKDEIRKASHVLFSTYDVDKFLEALIPLHDMVWFEGYGPYWCSKCRPYAGISKTGDALTVWNDIIGMGWDAEHHIWQKEDEICWTLMLPPTMELIEESRKEMESHDNHRSGK